MLKAAYTYSRDRSTRRRTLDWTEFLWNAPSVAYRNRAQADHNIPQNFQFGAVYELPFGADKKWATSGTSAAILGGWQLNGVFSAYEGRPFTMFASDASLNMPGNAQTADQIKADCRNLGNVGDAGTYFDTSAFARVTDVRFGNSGRNTMRGPGVVNLDLGLFRNFKLTDRFQLSSGRKGSTSPTRRTSPTRTTTSTAGDFGRISRRTVTMPSPGRGSSASACASILVAQASRNGAASDRCGQVSGVHCRTIVEP